MIFSNAVVGHAVSAVASGISSKSRKQRGRNKVRHSDFWEQGFIYWNNNELKKRMRVSRQIFNYNFTEIGEYIAKTSTKVNPAPTPTHVQLALSLYLLRHGYTYPVGADIFVISEPLACQVFNYICRILVARLYKKDVYMPNSDEEWQKERGGLIENNYEFPCVGSLNVFHI